MAQKVLIVDEKGQVKKLKPENCITGYYLEKRWEGIMKMRTRNQMANFEFSQEEWGRVLRELGFKGDVIKVCIDTADNVLAVLKKEKKLIIDPKTSN